MEGFSESAASSWRMPFEFVTGQMSRLAELEWKLKYCRYTCGASGSVENEVFCTRKPRQAMREGINKTAWSKSDGMGYAGDD